MFKVGDKVVPNGFRANGVHYEYGDNEIKSKWEEESKVIKVNSIDEDGCISATDGNNEFHYHPSELWIATEKEIEALNETKEQKREFEFDFGNNFYALKLDGGETFIASREDEDGDIWGLSDEDDADTFCINEDDIKKIIAIIPKR